jgi:pimeloyl-ACP methyl ester carboxylesterase
VTTITNDGIDLYYEVAGEGETVAFVGEAGYGAWQWGWQHRPITGPYRTVVWDMRGTGNSGSPPGPYEVDTLTADLEAILSETDTRRVHLIGAGLGGMVALRYARTYDRARSVTVFNTAQSGADVSEPALRNLFAPREDRQALENSLQGSFSERFRDRQGSVTDRICEWRKTEDAGARAFDAQVEAATAFETGPLYELTCPTLVCHGIDDPVVPIRAGRELAEGLPKGSFQSIEGRHLCFIEHARAVNDRILGFLNEHTSASPS